ncbi:MAG: four helix bundle protein [Kiritimatiellales bacterium]|jgi:four helix bundle protein
MAAEKTYDLEDRLIDFAVLVLNLSENRPRTPAGIHIAGQILRSGTSPAANYGEAQSAESRKDFVHKLKVALKELKETRIWLKIIDRKNYSRQFSPVPVLEECKELICILGKSISTAERNDSH